MLFDTLQLSKDLQESFSPQQAETLARVLASAGDNQLATKADFAALDAGLTVLKGDVAVFKSDMAVLKSDVATLKIEFAALKTDFKASNSRFQPVSLLWRFGSSKRSACYVRIPSAGS